MYGRQGNSGNTQPPPWLVRAEVTIRHGTPVTSESGQVPVDMSSTVTDSSGVRMIYRWNTNQSNPTTDAPLSSSTPPSTSQTTLPNPGSFGFQRGNILFTSTPPTRPSQGSFTIPRSASSGNDDSASSRGQMLNVSDSGYNSGHFSPQSYSSLPSRRPSQQYNRRCKSTCSIVLSSVATNSGTKKESQDRSPTEGTRSVFDESWRHRSAAHQHVFSRYQFTTVPEACEDCVEGAASSAISTHFCTRLQDKVESKSTVATSKDAASQTTDIESRASSSTISRGPKLRRKPTPGPHELDELRKKQQENQSGNSSVGATSLPGESEKSEKSEKSDSSAVDESGKRKSRTVHIDVYCTGSDEEASTNSSTENDCDTPMTVFENPDVRVKHTPKTSQVLPRGFQDDKAFLKRASERRCDSFRNAPMRLPSLASSKGYESDDVLSSLYPSQFSSYSALRDLDSTPWSAASSNAAIPFDYDSTIATSSKDTFSDIESLLHSKSGLTPSDSFEYASSSDRERIRRMEEMWAKVETEKRKNWRSPQIERKYLLQNKKMREFLEVNKVGWSSEESGADDSDESGTVGWSFISSDDNRSTVKKNLTVGRASKDKVETLEKVPTSTTESQTERKGIPEDHSDSTTRSDSIPHPYALRDQIGPFCSKSPSPLPSKLPSRVTSPFTTPLGEKTDHILKASRFGAVVNAFRKPGHHIGPSKNPMCSCDHCRRYFEEQLPQGRSLPMSEVDRRPGYSYENEQDINRPAPTNYDH